MNRPPSALTLSFCAALTLLTLSGGGSTSSAQSASQSNGAPHLETRAATTQLIVDGKPFLMLSGELHNSSSSGLDYMKPIWPELAAMHLNTVVTPLSWELIEPEEGKYDFALVDGLLAQARDNNERVVFSGWLRGRTGCRAILRFGLSAIRSAFRE
jgi:hypothetical protein